MSSLFLILRLQALLELTGWATGPRFTWVSTAVILLPAQGTQQMWDLKRAHQTPRGLVHVAKSGLHGLCLCQKLEQAMPVCWPQGQVSQHSSRLHSHILFISQNREAWTLVPTGSHHWPLLSPAYSLGGQSLALATSGLGGMAATGVPRATTCRGWGPWTRHGHQVMSAHRAMHGSAQTSWTKAALNVLHPTSPQSLKLGTA